VKWWGIEELRTARSRGESYSNSKQKSGTLGFLGGQNMASTVLEWQLIDPDEKTGEAREIRQSPGD